MKLIILLEHFNTPWTFRPSMKKDPELFSEGQTTLRGRDWSSQLKKNRPSYIKAQGMKDIKWGEQVWWLTTAWCFCMQWWRMVNASPRLLLCSSLGGKNCLSGEYGLFLNTWCDAFPNQYFLKILIPCWILLFFRNTLILPAFSGPVKLCGSLLRWWRDKQLSVGRWRAE